MSNLELNKRIFSVEVIILNVFNANMSMETSENEEWHFLIGWSMRNVVDK